MFESRQIKDPKHDFTLLLALKSSESPPDTDSYHFPPSLDCSCDRTHRSSRPPPFDCSGLVCTIWWYVILTFHLTENCPSLNRKLAYSASLAALAIENIVVVPSPYECSWAVLAICCSLSLPFHYPWKCLSPTQTFLLLYLPGCSCFECSEEVRAIFWAVILLSTCLWNCPSLIRKLCLLGFSCYQTPRSRSFECSEAVRVVC